jgi:peptidyl-prolyl cis-trans isomerase SDCCAG10
MSSVYTTEPGTQGKVVLKTTIGDLDVELWAKEAPKACRNFVQLCMEGYYDDCIFHRVIKEFIVQTGDPTGTGDGGESIFGKPFEDEVHSRLRFTHRGLVACASSGRNKNGSQFFITLDKTPDLERRHTIFGKITGDTVYNLLKFNDLEVDGEERPLHPPKVIGAEVLWNPFDDIKPRQLKKKVEEKAKDDRPVVKGVKNMALLSFGDEAEEEEVLVKSAVPKKVMSAIEDEEFERHAGSANPTKVKRVDKAQKSENSHVVDTKEDEPIDEKKEAMKREEEDLKKEIAKLNKKRKDREDDVEREKQEKPGAVEYRERMAKYKRAKVNKKDREYDLLNSLNKFEGNIKKDLYDGKLEQLNFKANPEDVDPMARNQDVDQYEVYDPRLERPQKKEHMNEHTRKLYAQKKTDKW